MVTNNSGTFKIKKSESTNKMYVVRDAFNKDASCGLVLTATSLQIEIVPVKTRLMQVISNLRAI